MNQPRVISYRRFSSRRQEKGHSLERQSDAAEKWCLRMGWVLDDLRPTDLGVSAFTGAHRDRGALGVLLDKIKDGSIEPGTYLLIEALDRLTREVLTEAVPLFVGLINSGLVIVTLSDEKVWTKEGLDRDMSDFMFSIMLLARGHEESRRKGAVVRASFEKGRQRRSRREFGSAPGWLQRASKDAPWTVIEDRAESVRKVFELASQGFGTKAIAKRANGESWPIPTRDTVNKPTIWHATMPGRLLRMREVTGVREYRLMGHDAKKRAKHWKGEASGIEVPDYYPRIVSDELWHRARASIAQRMTKPRRRDEHYFNIWSGLLRCGECGATLQRKQEDRGKSKAQLVCSNKLAGVTSCRTGAASKTDGALLLGICSVGGRQMGLGYDKDKVLKAIDVVRSKLTDNEKRMSNIVEGIAAIGPTAEFVAKARSLKEERAVLEAELVSRQQALATEPNSLLDTSYAERVIANLYERTTEAMELRADCHVRLCRAVDAIWHFAYDVAIVKFKGSRVLQEINLGAKKPGEIQVRMQRLLSGDREWTWALPGLDAFDVPEVTADDLVLG